ncbi:MAG TPA: hypothetical protein VM490_02190 [Armatimonadaceae bacterium]|nr:hypothetical protein [Armatimonadaceae bacterium]
MAISTAARVAANTDPEVNERIRRRTEQSVLYCAGAGPRAVAERLAEVEREWDVERVIETEAPLMALSGIALGATVHRRFFAVPGVVAAMLFLHAVQGWYPLLPVFRRLGLRTREEIHEERYALKALRGDFAEAAAARGADAQKRADAVLRAVRR